MSSRKKDEAADLDGTVEKFNAAIDAVAQGAEKLKAAGLGSHAAAQVAADVWFRVGGGELKPTPAGES